MGYTVIAPAGDNLKALFIGMKEFPTERVVFLAPSSNLKEVRACADRLKDFTIESEIIEIEEGNVLEEMFKHFGVLCARFNHDDLIVNVATGDKITSCAALSAAFANGIKAFGISGTKTMLLPIMKLSYYNELSDNKLKLLKELDSDNYTTVKELQERTKMSVSLLSYHINGNYKYKGLKNYRLVEVKERNNNLLVKLSDMGRLLIKGYIQKKADK